MRRLTRRQVLALHAHALAETGGADGIRDEGMLDAALESPYTGFEETEFYPTAQAKAARLAYSLVNDHPFVDGNKRVGVLAMAVLLEINGITLGVTDDDLICHTTVSCVCSCLSDLLEVSLGVAYGPRRANGTTATPSGRR